MPFWTVTPAGVETVVLPAGSFAVAVRAWNALLAVVVFQTTEYGGIVTGLPRAAPSSRNWTLATTTLSAAVAETATLAPLTVDPLVGAVIDTVGGIVSALTVSVNEVVCVIEPEVAVTAIEDVPRGVNDLVFRASDVVHVAVQEAGVNAAVALAGRPAIAKVTAAAVPEASVAATDVATASPCTTLGLPPFDKVKSNPAGVVAEAGLEGLEEFPAASKAEIV